MSRLTDLRNGIVTALQTVNGTGSYVNTLTGQDQVTHGLYAVPPRSGVPCVMLAEWSVGTTEGPQLGRWTRTVTWALVCWAPANGDSPAAKWGAVETLADDITIALEVACRTSGGALNGIAYDCIVSDVNEVEVSGDATGYAIFALAVEFKARANKTGGL